MPKKPKAYFRPNTLSEALNLLAQPGYVALGGGAHLLATEAGVEAEGVVDLQDIGLQEIQFDAANRRLVIGATARLADVWEYLYDVTLPGELPSLLQKAIHQAGPNTYRNAATLGGVVASRLPDSELLAALLVAETTLDLRLPQAESVSLADYLAAETRPAGLITAITVPLGPGKAVSERVARTPADYPIVSVTGWLPAGAPVRLAATGIAERPLRLPEAETAVAAGLIPTAVQSAAAAAQAAARHPGDFRGSADYRAEMAAVLTRRVLDGLALD